MRLMWKFVGWPAVVTSIAVAAGCSSGTHRAAITSTTTPASTPAASTPATSALPASGPTTSTPAAGGPTTTSAPPAGGPTTSTASTLPIATFSNWSGVKPGTIYFSGDAGNIVSSITWSTWTSDSATGQGTWGYDDCNPNCAQGHVTNYPTTVKLSGASGRQFTQLVEIQTGPFAHTLTYTLPSTFIGASSS
jgi:hypothetical protein